MQIEKWGSNLAIRLPESIVESLVLKEGDEVSLKITGERSLEISKKTNAKDLLKKLRSLRGRLPNDFVFDRQKASS